MRAKNNRSVAKFLLSKEKCGGEVQSESVAKFLQSKKKCEGEVQSQKRHSFCKVKRNVKVRWKVKVLKKVQFTATIHSVCENWS